MALWKKILLRSAGFGAGFAIATALVIGGWHWYRARPKPPRPWNKQAITATYDGVHPEGENNDLAFDYILQNNTDWDLRIDSDLELQITAKLKKEQALSENGRISTTYSIFVPAKGRAWISLTTPYAYPFHEKEKATASERKQFRAAVPAFVADKLADLDGFVFFDADDRYETVLPDGWNKQKTK
jgi:hypothetical protein